MTASRLDGRTALVTGASRGIGAAAARALDRAGARVAVSGRDRGDLEGVAAELTHHPVVLVGDLRDAAAVAQLATEAIQALGPVDVLVNNAAA
ncbi:MAG: SDR family NAD(P)-dependent oxidoreductase, partial [Acidimicrobiales bacterium]